MGAGESRTTMAEGLGMIGLGVVFVGVGVWMRVDPDSFVRLVPSHRSEAYNKVALRFLPPIAVVFGLFALVIGVLVLASG